MTITRLPLALALVFALLAGSRATAQTASMTYADLFELKGRVIARGTNTNPIGPSGLKTYRIEELTLPPGTRIALNGSVIQADTAWRITLIGNAFDPRDLPPIISIDSTALLPAQESKDLVEVAAITFDRALLRDGATIALSYGSQRTELLERIRGAAAR